MAINSPTILGDQFLIGVVKSDDHLTLGNANYSRPIGFNGLRAQAGLAYTSYQVGKELASSQRSGNALIGITGLTYAMVRSNAGNLMLGTSAVRKNFTDYTGTVAADKFTNSFPVSLQFDMRDQMLGPAITFGSVVFTYGRLSDSSLRTASAINREGGYKKINIDVIRQQQLPQQFVLVLRSSIQRTTDNLDSSEDFVLGGPTGIRAYPTGEAAGDRGWLGQIELQRRFQRYQPYIFYDYGKIDTNARVTGSNTNLSKQRAGAGIGLRIESGNLYTDAIIARRTSKDLAESDTTHPAVQAWLTMSYRY